MSLSKAKLAVAFGIVAGALEPWLVQPAWAVVKGGKYINYIADMDGVLALSSVGNFTPRSAMCTILPTTYETFAVQTAQAEVGLYSCNGTQIGPNGNCNLGGYRKYYETLLFSTYVCIDQGAATTNTAYEMRTYRSGTAPNGSDYVSSYIQGVWAGTQQNFWPAVGQSYKPAIWYGLEVTYNGGPTFPCDSSWKASGSWSYIQYRQRSTGNWKSVTASTAERECINLTAFSSSGGFSAYHQ